METAQEFFCRNEIKDIYLKKNRNLKNNVACIVDLQ